MVKQKDPNETAFDALQEILNRDAERDGIPPESTPEPKKNPDRVKAGRKGGKRGGPARAKKLTPEKRKEISDKAAKARWGIKK